MKCWSWIRQQPPTVIDTAAHIQSLYYNCCLPQMTWWKSVTMKTYYSLIRCHNLAWHTQEKIHTTYTVLIPVSFVKFTITSPKMKKQWRPASCFTWTAICVFALTIDNASSGRARRDWRGGHVAFRSPCYIPTTPHSPLMCPRTMI